MTAVYWPGVMVRPSIGWLIGSPYHLTRVENKVNAFNVAPGKSFYCCLVIRGSYLNLSLTDRRTYRPTDCYCDFLSIHTFHLYIHFDRSGSISGLVVKEFTRKKYENPIIAMLDAGGV